MYHQRSAATNAGEALAIGALLVVLAVLVVLPDPARAELPPGREVDQIEACLQCHDLSDALEADHQHAPAVAGECSACHNPHASRFDALLLRQPGPLCGQCHSGVAHELERPVVHRPVAEGRCAACHEPHGSERAALLRAGGEDLCVTCHQEVAAWRERRVQHPPFATGACATCHEPHASEVPNLLVGTEGGTGANVCLRCHDRGPAFRQAHSGYPVEQAACQQCHDPHASAERGLFRETSHPPFADGDCSLCHRDAGAREPFTVDTPVGELCGQCHPDAVKEGRQASFPHVPAGGGDCVACHNPHTGSGSALLKAPEKELCPSCHDPGGAESGPASGQEGRYLSHGKGGVRGAGGGGRGGLDCTTCHQAHGAERPVLLVQDPIDLCGECHSHEHTATHPLGESTRDPRTGNPMTCRSCHGIHDAPYEYHLYRSEERELCLSCHKEIGGGA